MNLQEAIFKINNLSKEISTLSDFVASGHGLLPCKVDDKIIDNSSEEKAVENSYNELQDKTKEFLELKKRLNRSNLEYGILDKIEEVKELRKLISTLTAASGLSFSRRMQSRVSVEPGVGVIKYKPLKEEFFLNELKKCQRKAEELSLEIDRLNLKELL